MQPLTFCLSEDRRLEEVALRLALCSLRRHCPDANVVVYRPDPTQDLRAWLGGFPRVELIPALPEGASSWNCKPHTLIPLLERGLPQVIWLDSDIVLARSCAHIFAGLQDDQLAIAQEQISSDRQGSEERTRGWGLPVGRRLTRTVNTCVLRVTSEHLPLLRRWAELLGDDRYRHFQSRPFHERPVQFLSDQDVLNALLGSAEFSDIPLHLVRTGRDVVHSGGALAYSLEERLRGALAPTPPFIHGQGTKLWWAFDERSLQENRGGWWFRRRLLLEVSPYMAEVKRYRDEVGVDCPWMDYSTALGRGLTVAGFNNVALRGLPLTIAATALRRLGGGQLG